MTLPFDPTRRREERDDLERLLEAALPGALSSDVPGHVDVERLAAWADGGLDAAEQLQVDAHLAACGSCQELAAAVARTDADAAAAGIGIETSPEVVRRWTPVRLAKWAAPLAAAAAVIVWMVQPDDSLPAPDPIQRGEQGQTANFSQRTEAPALVAADETKRVRQQAAASQPPRADLAQRDLESRALRTEAPTSAATPAPAATPPAAAPPPPATSPPAPAAGASANRAATEVMTGMDQPRPVFEIVTRVVVSQGQAAGRGGGGRGGALAGRPAAGATVVEPRWRVVDGRRVERSLDAGLTWSPLDIDPPAALVAGGSPATSVCWLVGEHGLVLVTTDGERFTSATAPADITLSSVDAATARDATVTSLDGRRFVTSDGGRTWRPLP